MSNDPEIRMHKEWQGLLQPVGLVVSPLALVRKQAVIDRSGAARWQAELAGLLDDTEEAKPEVLRDLPTMLERVLGWVPQELYGGRAEAGSPALPESVEVRLPELEELLRPTYAVAEPGPVGEGGPKWLMLVQELAPRVAMDEPPKDEGGRGWHAPPQAKFERMLRELGVPMGLLCNGEALRLVYAPRGETSGHVTFPFGVATAPVNWPVAGALHMLLSGDRLLGMGKERRLLALLEESRKYQNEVSTKLAEQVLLALIELLRGFGAADEGSGGLLLGDKAGHDAKHVYGGLLTVLLRLVFVLYAEDRGLLPGDPVWSNNYSVVGLFERLREDAGRFPDTMDQRFGAWAWLVTLFRLVYLGGGHGAGIHLPARKGQLFDPNEYPFLEGRGRAGGFDPGERLDELPRVSDGTVFRVLQGLLVLEGERLSYRSLDVEQIGSVYESMMGYEVERAKGASIGVGPQHVVVSLEELLKEKASKRVNWLAAQTGVKVDGAAGKALEAAKTPEEVVAAVQRRVSRRTPGILAKGSLYLQPGEERRRTGSHYTPRSLTEPIVRTTLRPVLEDLGWPEKVPSEAEILGLKVCDPAMGSGAFLVEACRQLAEVLERSWERYGTTRVVPADEEPLLHARRLVAEHCLYGVDKNPFAVNLAKLSLWLATLAKEHPFTFLDHALKHGDSLVGLSRRQIAEFRWDDEVGGSQIGPLFARVTEKVVEAVEARQRIHGCGEDQDAEKRLWNEEAERALEDARLLGDAVVAAFFGAEKDKEREKARARLWDLVQRWFGGEEKAKAEVRAVVRELREEKGVVPFHWEVEFPEVFSRERPGFDAFAGNPPFAGKNTMAASLPVSYPAWLQFIHEGSHGNSDLVAHFFRRAFAHLSATGTLGFVATNTVGQGDTRNTGLRMICRNGGVIYAAWRRLRWPGQAAVVVSVVHVSRALRARVVLDARPVERISSYLFHLGPDADPLPLRMNQGVAFQGTIVLGVGFTFDDTDPSGEATPLSEMRRLVSQNPDNTLRIFPYINGRELNADPRHSCRRYVINFGSMDEAEARRWPDLFRIVEEKVKPSRAHLTTNAIGRRRAHYWWQFASPAKELYSAIEGKLRVLVAAQTSKYRTFTFLPSGMVYDQKLIVFALDSLAALCVLQSRVHEMWALFSGSSMKDDPVYTPSDCFSTFPFPVGWREDPALEAAGQTYYDYRAALMIQNNEGLTDTYNRFHDPDETSPDILELRRLHAAMDHAVLTAYGWDDLAAQATCEFQLDYEEPEPDDEDAPSKRKKKKPWRYKWPQALHDEVLARLLELNQQYAEAERLAGEAAQGETAKARPAKKVAGKKAGKKTSKKKTSKAQAATEQIGLLNDDD